MATKTSITLSDEDIELLEELREFFKAKSFSEVIKKSIVQTTNISRLADEDGNVRVKTKDGETYVVPRRW